MLKDLSQRWRMYRHRYTRALAGDMADPAARRVAMRHLMWIDHGLLRRVWTNMFEIGPGVYRGNQPDPARIDTLAARGFRSIVTLRGTDRYSWLVLEEEACARHGIDLHVLKLSASRMDEAQVYLTLLDVIDAAPKPLLIHCKSGADRTGIAAALYQMDKGVPPEQAARQLALRYAHRRNSKAGSLDYMVAAYAGDHAETGIGLRDWLRTRYDPAALNAAYRQERRK